MRDWQSNWSSGRCKLCKERHGKWGLYIGLCLPCRVPEDRRELVSFGVPWSTANVLANIMSKCNGDAEFVLGKVHPRLMQNIVIVKKTLRVRDKNYRWVRRDDWMKMPTPGGLK